MQEIQPGVALKTFGHVARSICKTVGFVNLRTKPYKPWSFVILDPKEKEFIACILIRPDSYQGTQCLHIDQLAVKPLQQNQGVGTYLLQIAIAFQNHHCGLQIDSFDSRVENLQLRHGFLSYGITWIQSDRQVNLYRERNVSGQQNQPNLDCEKYQPNLDCEKNVHETTNGEFHTSSS